MIETVEQLIEHAEKTAGSGYQAKYKPDVYRGWTNEKQYRLYGERETFHTHQDIEISESVYAVITNHWKTKKSAYSIHEIFVGMRTLISIVSLINPSEGDRLKRLDKERKAETERKAIQRKRDWKIEEARKLMKQCAEFVEQNKQYGASVDEIANLKKSDED